MAFTRAPVTALATFGAPGPIASAVAESQIATDTLSVSVTDASSLLVLAEITASDTVSISVTDTSALITAEVSSYVTELGVWGAPRPYQILAGVTAVSVFALEVSDTLSVQWLEEPVDENTITSGDTLRVTLSEVASLRNNIAAFDTLSVSITENIALIQSGVTLKTASDTVSVTLTETTAISVTVEVTDTASVTFSGETATLTTPVEVVVASDTLSVSVDEAALLQVFTGINPLSVSDSAFVSLLESATIVARTPVDPYRIRIIPRMARIRIIPQ
jgi:hypothetical protein